MSVPKEYPPTKVTIKVTQQDAMEIDAYESPTPGLVIHRQVRWAPGKEEYKLTSKWQVTHSESGLGLLTPTKCLPRQKDALKFAKRLSEHCDWKGMTPQNLADDQDLLGTVKSVYEGVIREHDAEEAGEVVLDEEYNTSFVIQKNRDSRQFEVVDSKTKKVVASFAHRGTAWKEAHRRNQQVNVSLNQQTVD